MRELTETEISNVSGGAVSCHGGFAYWFFNRICCYDSGNDYSACYTF